MKRIVYFALILILITSTTGCNNKVIEEPKEVENNVEPIQIKEQTKEPTCEEKYNKLMLQYDTIIAEAEKLRCDKWINDEEQMKKCMELNNEAQKTISELKELDCSK